MLSKDKMERINILAKKAKTNGLTKQEAEEQKQLRHEYLQTFRKSFLNDLHSVKFVDPNGKDVTPAKLKESKKSSSSIKH